MNQKAIYIVILFGLFFISCDPPVSFNEPQPADTKSLNEFPWKLQGEYLNNDGTRILNIKPKLIYRIYDFDMKVHINELDSNYKLIGDTLYNLAEDKKEFVSIEGDSVFQHFHHEDTLFIISDKNQLKKFKGYYFLNFFEAPSWYVKKLSLAKGILTISTISTHEEINALREITETTSDTTSYNFKPTRKQFRKFIKYVGFSEAEYYIRLK